MPTSEIFCCCEGSEPVEGGFNLLGVTSGLIVPTTPATIQVGVFARVRFAAEEAGPHSCAFVYEGPDGECERIDGETIDVQPFEDELHTFSHIQAGLNLGIRAYGDYRIALEIDGARIADAIFAIAAMPPEQTPENGP